MTAGCCGLGDRARVFIATPSPTNQTNSCAPILDDDPVAVLGLKGILLKYSLLTRNTAQHFGGRFVVYHRSYH